MKRKSEPISASGQDEDLQTAKRPRYHDQLKNDNDISILPDGLVAHILSYLCDTCYSSVYTRRHNTVFELRLVSSHFRRVIGDSVPCFAMLKLLMSEYDRVSSTNDNTDTDTREQESPWLTPTEVSMITLKRLIDLNEPLPSPHLMPLTALQIVASTMVCEINWQYVCERASDVELIYAVAGVGVFIQTINDEKSPLNGKQIIVQKVMKKQHIYCTCCGEPYLSTRFMVTDENTAKQLGININTLYENELIIREIEYEDRTELHRTELQFPQLEIPEYHSILYSAWYGSFFATLNSNTLTTCNTNVHYRRNKTLWDQFPKLPPAVYKVLNEPYFINLVRLKHMISVIEHYKLNVIFKSYTSNRLRQLYSGDIERHNVEYLINDLTLLPINDAPIRTLFSANMKTKLYLPCNPCLVEVIQAVVSSLVQQSQINIPVPLTAIDFNRMLHILSGGDPLQFGAPNKKHYQVPLKTEIIYIAECALPLGATIYSAYNEKLDATIYYSVLLSKGWYDHVALQLFQTENTYWFRMRQWSHLCRPVEVFKSYSLDVAKELFEYWLGYWMHLGLNYAE